MIQRKALAAAPPHPAAGAGDRGAAMQYAGGAILTAAVTFNAWLALANAHGVPVNNGIVSVVQAGIVAAALALAIVVRPAGLMRWALLLWGLATLFLLLSLMRERIEPRYLGDVAVIFAFVMLGLCLRARTLVAVLVLLQVMLCAFVVWEIVSPEGFGAAFRVQTYYIATRGLSEESFWAKDSQLFVSAQRPGGRLLLAGMGAHRASSLFLEPVSLGNWTVVVLLAAGALWRSLSRMAIAVLALGNLLLLIACDGRLAMALNLALLPVMVIAPRVPRWVAPAVLPAVFVLLAVAERSGMLGVGDTFAGRLHYGAAYLMRLDVAELLGLSGATGTVAADSGWAYFIISQSLPGVLLIWLALTLPPGADTPAKRRLVLGIALFLAAALPVSYSVFSIKTAALLWAVYGHAIGASLVARSSIVATTASQSRMAARTAGSGARQGIAKAAFSARTALAGSRGS